MISINVYADDVLFPYLTGDMLEGKRVVRVIKGVRHEEVATPGKNDKTKKLMLVFHGTSKRMVLNKTNVKQIIKLFGSNTDSWRDQPIELYSEEVNAFGSVHNSVRVAEKKPAMPRDVAEKLKPVSDQDAKAVLA